MKKRRIELENREEKREIGAKKRETNFKEGGGGILFLCGYNMYQWVSYL